MPVTLRSLIDTEAALPVFKVAPPSTTTLPFGSEAPRRSVPFDVVIVPEYVLLPELLVISSMPLPVFEMLPDPCMMERMNRPDVPVLIEPPVVNSRIGELAAVPMVWRFDDELVMEPS